MNVYPRSLVPKDIHSLYDLHSFSVPGLLIAGYSIIVMSYMRSLWLQLILYLDLYVSGLLCTLCGWYYSNLEALRF